MLRNKLKTYEKLSKTKQEVKQDVKQDVKNIKRKTIISIVWANPNNKLYVVL